MAIMIRAIGPGGRHVEWDYDPLIEVIPWHGDRFIVRKRFGKKEFQDLGNFAADWSVVMIDTEKSNV